MKERSSNERITIYLSIFFILFLVVIILLYVFGIIGKGPATVDAVLNQDVIVKYENDKWQVVKSKDYSNYNWNKFRVYEEGKKKGTYSLYTSDNEFYIFKVKNGERTPMFTLDNNLYLGGRKNSDFVEFNKEELSESDTLYISSVLRNNNVSDSDLTNYILGYKVVKDFDGDNRKEKMYVISNVFNDQVNNTAYSLIFIKHGDKTKYIYKKIVAAKDSLNQCKIDLLGLIKIENVDKMQIVTKCSYYSYSNNEYGIYQNKNNNYQLLLYIK